LEFIYLLVFYPGADVVDGVKNLKLSATIVNTGDETLKLLNDPRSLLNKLPTHSFNIVNGANGATPKFRGVKAKYNPALAAKIGREDALTTLAPGASVTVDHDRERKFILYPMICNLCLQPPSLSFERIQFHPRW
jgi:hypothetical protein